MSEPAPIIRVEQLSKRFGNGVTAVDGVDLQIREGEFFALLGPSGCGKTTLLRMLAGFEVASGGRVFIDGRDMHGVPPNRRDVNMVFQSYAVFPHMNVFDNVAYGLRVSGTARAQIGPRVNAALALVKLEEHASRRPEQLSGGQRQRVALARALVKRPRVLLLDEPLSALDARLREAMQLELVRLQKTVGITFVIVTHDQHEALSMADRIAVMDTGRVRQVASPAQLYECPSCCFVADFIGKMNLFEGEALSGDDDAVDVEIPGLGRLQLPHPFPGRRRIVVAVRPERLEISRARPANGVLAFEATLEQIAYRGGDSAMYFTTASGVSLASTVPNTRHTGALPQRGERLWVSWHADDTLLLSD